MRMGSSFESSTQEAAADILDELARKWFGGGRTTHDTKTNLRRAAPRAGRPRDSRQDAGATRPEAWDLLLYPPAFNSVSTCFAISFKVSNTPTPWKAIASTMGSFFLRSSVASRSMGRILGRSRLFNCST